MPTLRTLIPPRSADAHSFSGIGRFQYARAIVVTPPSRPAQIGGVYGDIYGDMYGEGAVAGAPLGAPTIVPIESLHDGAPGLVRG